MTSKQITKTLNKAGIFRGFEARKAEVELFIELNDTKTANSVQTERLFRRVRAALKAAGLDWAAYKTGYGAWVVSCGKPAARLAREASFSLALDQLGAGAYA